MVPRLKAFLGAAALWLVATAAPPAAAQPSDAPSEAHGGGTPVATQDAATARALFVEGLGYVQEGKWALAADRFRRVVAIRPSHVAAYNLASALAHVGAVVESAEILRDLRNDGTAPEETRKAAGELLEDVEPRIGSITIRITGDTKGHEVLLDGELLGPAMLVQFRDVDPGAYTVVLRRGSVTIATRRVVVGGDEPMRAECRFDLNVSDSVAGAAAEADADAGGGVSLGPWWLWAGAGAAVVVAVGVVVLAGSGSDASPAGGDTDPPVVRGVVQGTMP